MCIIRVCANETFNNPLCTGTENLRPHYNNEKSKMAEIVYALTKVKKHKYKFSKDVVAIW